MTRLSAPGRTLHLILTICAAGYGVHARGGMPVVCGLPPGHDGNHRDVQHTLEWSDQ
jgi:hypothetical protein